eukprot:1158527-Pelagomonas_calceolata.AAC.1
MPRLTQAHLQQLVPPAANTASSCAEPCLVDMGRHSRHRAFANKKIYHLTIILHHPSQEMVPCPEEGVHTAPSFLPIRLRCHRKDGIKFLRRQSNLSFFAQGLHILLSAQLQAVA